MFSIAKTAWARFGVYIIALIGAAFAFMGLADFDATTGVFDIRPFNMYTAVGVSASGLGNVLAVIALVKGWRTRR